VATTSAWKTSNEVYVFVSRIFQIRITSELVMFHYLTNFPFHRKFNNNPHLAVRRGVALAGALGNQPRQVVRHLQRDCVAAQLEHLAQQQRAYLEQRVSQKNSRELLWTISGIDQH